MPGLKCSRSDCPRARECIRYMGNYHREYSDQEKARPEVQRIILKKIGNECEFFFPIKAIMT